jgi:methylmalonic aciduria homocystinuria type C protein
MERWQTTVHALATALAPQGFDLTAALRVGWYNDAVGQRSRLPDYGRPDSLAIVVGNTREFWTPFIDALRDNADLLADPNPVEAYSMRCIAAAAEATGETCEIRWAHRVDIEVIAIQRLAHIAGLAWLAPSNLCVHPEYGPWIALRAVIVFDLEGPPGPPPTIADPCGACDQGCGPAFQRALAGDGFERAEPWEPWLALRDACPLGRAHRYEDDQIRYHYAKDRSVLLRAVRARGPRHGEKAAGRISPGQVPRGPHN